MDLTTIELLDAINLRKPLHEFFSDFFPAGKTHTAEKIQLDVKKGKRAMAPFVSPRQGGKVLKRQGFKTVMIDTPRLAPETILTIDDISKRGLGENIYDGKTPEEREMDLFAEDTTDLEERILRRKNWMAREILYNGKFGVTDEEAGYDFEVDFGFSNKETLVTGWDEAGSDPIADLKRGRLACIQKSGKAPTVVILASDVVDAFKNNAAVQKAMDIKNFNFAVYEPKVKDDAVTFLGVISELNLEIYSYDDWYIDDNGTEQPFVPKGTVLMLPATVGSMEYGLVTQYEGDAVGFKSYAAEMVPLVYGTVKDNAKMYRMTSRPVPRPFDVDGWYVFEGVTA